MRSMKTGLISLLLAALVAPVLAALPDDALRVTDLPENSAPPTVPAAPKLAYGVLMQHQEKLVFSPCRDRSYVLVEDVSPRRVLTGHFAEMGLPRGQRLYVELIGIVENGKLLASDFNMLRVEGRCQMPGGREESWRAAGNDPAWALVLGAEYVQVQRFGQPELALPFSGIEGEGNVRQFSASGDWGRLSLRFDKQSCLDGAAQARFAWSARVELNGELLQGCAWQR